LSHSRFFMIFRWFRDRANILQEAAQVYQNQPEEADSCKIWMQMSSHCPRSFRVSRKMRCWVIVDY
jgi:hypothetical protein